MHESDASPADHVGGTPPALREIDELLPTLYEELHALASGIVQRHRALDAARTTSLIQDTYVRLAERGIHFKNQSHFLCLAAKAMRFVLIDRARRTRAAKRGGAVTIEEPVDGIAPAADGPDLLAVEEALTRLSAFDERKGRIVELRFFGGLSVDESAAALGISPATVKREWSLARAWLSREIGEPVINDA